MERYQSNQSISEVGAKNAYTTPYLLEYGSVVKLTQDSKNKSHRNDNLTCTIGNQSAGVCVERPGSNSNAPAKRRDKRP